MKARIKSLNNPQTSLPEYFIEEINRFFPNDAQPLLDSITNGSPVRGVRANTLKISPDDLAGLLKLKERVPWCEQGFYIDADFRPAKSPFYHAGLFYAQEPSAMSAAALFNIERGDRVLDLCAAPGGKTTQLAAKLQGAGVIAANDTSNARSRALVKNIELAGITNAVVLNEEPQKLAERFKGFFNKILIDAPCSGEGMFRRDIDAIKNYAKHKSEKLAAIGRGLLSAAARMLCAGGEIMYSTCTFSPLENEMVIGDFLSKNPEFSLNIISGDYGFSKGVPSFYKNKQIPQLEQCARLFPHKIKGEGFFAAYLKKNGEPCFTGGSSAVSQITPVEYRVFYDFIKKNFTDLFYNDLFAGGGKDKTKFPTPANGYFVMHKNSLYITPACMPLLNGIRVIRSGFYLGDIKKDRFEPSQALAMSLKKQHAVITLDFAPEEPMLIKYLRGESFETDKPNGFCLVCVSGYPLGFGKITNGRLKNKYPVSWVLN